MLRAVVDPGVLIVGLISPRAAPYFSEEQALDMVHGLGPEAVVVDDPAHRPAVTRDAKDDYLVALAVSAVSAVSAKVDVLVSGDKDLTDLDDAGVLVLSPRAFLDRLPGPSGPGRGAWR